MDKIEEDSPIRLKLFLEKVHIRPSGCWEWLASRNAVGGYGLFWNGERTQVAHRFLYELIYGIVPEGVELDHLCRNKRCVNPHHLEVVTRSENTRRGVGPGIARTHQLAKTECPYGHPYNEENTYIYPNGRRGCRLCSREASREWRLRHGK